MAGGTATELGVPVTHEKIDYGVDDRNSTATAKQSGDATGHETQVPEDVEPEQPDSDKEVDLDTFRYKYCPGPTYCEDLEMYAPGGLHPIDIGDVIGDRYKVIHKLGNGASATVWLARDLPENRYVAVKVLAADCYYMGEIEVSINLHLRQKMPASTFERFIVPLHHSLTIDGPNGKHLCLVFAVSGLSLASMRHGQTLKIRPDIGRKAAHQLAEGLRAIHMADVVYGDLSTGNVLLSLNKGLVEWTEQQLYEELGKPEPWEVTPAKKQLTAFVSTHGPKVVYEPIDLKSEKALQLLGQEVKFVDFGGSYIRGLQNESSGMALTESYADSESIFWGEAADSASDVWALACMWFEIRSSVQLFPGGLEGIGIPFDINNTLGKVPQEWEDRANDEYNDQETSPAATAPQIEAARDRSLARLSRSAKRSSFQFAIAKLRGTVNIRSAYIRAARWTRKLTRRRALSGSFGSAVKPEERTLAWKIQQIGVWKLWSYLTVEQRMKRLERMKKDLGAAAQHIDASREACDTGAPPHGPLSKAEARALEDVLKMMLTWNRADRAKIDDVLDHPWLTDSFGDQDSGPWIEQYHPGRGYSARDKVYI
jgi:serine/threonine-protein kinase SRPK3